MLPVKGYILTLSLLFGLGLPLAWFAAPSWPSWDALLFWTLLALFLAHLAVPLPLLGQVSLHFVGALALVFAFPPFFASLVSPLVLPPRLPLDPWREAFNRAQVGLATLAASLLYRETPSGLGVLLAGLAYFLVNLGSVLLLAHLVKGLPPAQLWRRNFAPYGVSYLLVSPVAYLLVRAYQEPLIGSWGGFGVALMLLPLLYLRYTWLLQSRLEEASKRMLQGMVATLEAKDPYTASHSERVAAIAADIAREMGLGEAQQKLVLLGARLHDIGKVGIPDAVLSKRGPLTPEEWAKMRSHPELGFRIVHPMLPFLGPLGEVIRSHHERFDGGGYPEGLKGQDIPVLARIVAVADAYEAMTSHRPYRSALSPERALEEILRGAGTQFDPEVVAAFRRAAEKAPPWLTKETFLHLTLEVDR